MTYLQQQRSPLQSLPGLGAVILLHLGLIYALLNGLGTNIVEKFAPPPAARIIDVVPPTPSPPPPPAPDITAPQALVVPLPEVTIAHPALPHAPLATTHTPLPAAPAPRAPGSAEHDFQASQLVAGERAPAYPEAFADSGRAGRVAVDCVIEVTGNPSHCRVVSASGGAAFAAETMRWLTGPAHPVYRPAIRDGQPRREDHQWVVSFQAPE